MLEVKELIKLRNLCIHHVMLQSELKYLMAAEAVGTIKLEPQSGSNPAKNPRFYVLSGQQPHQDKAGGQFGRVLAQTELFIRSKPIPLAGYPYLLLTLVPGIGHIKFRSIKEVFGRRSVHVSLDSVDNMSMEEGVGNNEEDLKYHEVMFDRDLI